MQGTISRGMKGSAVQMWQKLLISAGYALPLYGADSDFGGETEGATRQFQTDMGAKVDGIVGAETFHAMKEKLGLAKKVDRPPPGPLPGATGRTTAGTGKDLKKVLDVVEKGEVPTIMGEGTTWWVIFAGIAGIALIARQMRRKKRKK